MPAPGSPRWNDVIVGFMGVFGEMFPGKKLSDEGSGDQNGEKDRPRVDLDLDAGVIRLSSPAHGRAEEAGST